MGQREWEIKEEVLRASSMKTSNQYKRAGSPAVANVRKRTTKVKHVASLISAVALICYLGLVDA